MRKCAFAKINLFLDVTQKRKDGYHNISSVMQTLALCDDLLISLDSGEENEPSDSPDSVRSVRLDINIPDLPGDDSNLVTRGAKAIMEEYNITRSVNIELFKRIPMGAGLGGGSSDCAAVLHGMNELFSLGIPLHRLIEIGKALGADVPFCLMGGAALAGGIGEELTPLPLHPECYVILLCPELHVSTAEIFGRISPFQYNSLDLDKFMDAYNSGDLSRIAANICNVFTEITGSVHNEINELMDELMNQGALGASMTGTGSAVFGYFSDAVCAGSAYEQLKRVKRKFKTQVFLTQTENTRKG